MQKQPKESEFYIKLIKLIKLSFEHKENIKNVDEFSLDVGLRPEYIKNEDLIQFYLYVKIDLYQNDNENRKIEIYYYEIKTDEKPNLNKTSYTKHEKAGGFELRTIPLNKLEDELRKNAKEFGDKKGITREMLELLKIYKSS